MCHETRGCSLCVYICVYMCVDVCVHVCRCVCRCVYMCVYSPAKHGSVSTSVHSTHVMTQVCCNTTQHPKLTLLTHTSHNTSPSPLHVVNGRATPATLDTSNTGHQPTQTHPTYPGPALHMIANLHEPLHHNKHVVDLLRRRNGGRRCILLQLAMSQQQLQQVLGGAAKKGE